MLIKNFTIYRGDATIITWEVAEDLTGKVLLFGIKANKNLTSERLVEHTPNYTGGIVTVEIEAGDTADLIQSNLFYDLINLTDNETIATGKIILIGDVITPFDGFALPEHATRVLNVDISSFNENDMLIVKTINGQKVITSITIDELKTLLGIS